MATAEHYRAYTPKPFTRAERDSTTILFGGRHWRLELRAHLDAHPEMKGTTYRIPPTDVTDVTTDLVLHITAKTRRRAAA